MTYFCFFFFSSRRRHTRFDCDWSSDVCSSDLSTAVYDVVREQIYRRSGEGPLEIPSGAVVVPGARAVPGAAAARWGLSLYTPVIIKYRDEKTDAATLLEADLR